MTGSLIPVALVQVSGRYTAPSSRNAGTGLWVLPAQPGVETGRNQRKLATLGWADTNRKFQILLGYRIA